MDWETMDFKAPTEELVKRRETAQKEAFEKLEKEKQQKVLAKREEETRLVQKQIEVERATRLRVEALKESEKQEAQV